MWAIIMAMESEQAKKTRVQLEAVRPELDAWDREFIDNLFMDEPSFDYLSGITTRRIEKIFRDAERRKRSPGATWMA